jgi:hypothetical protein
VRHLARIACAAALVAVAACGSHRLAVAPPVVTTVVTTTVTAVPSTTSPVTTVTSVSTPPAQPLVARPLAFVWTVHVLGRSVTVGGTWSGTDRSLTAAQIAADPEITSAAQTGSGLLAYAGTVLTASGAQVPPGTAPADADFTQGVYSTNGDIPTCVGAVIEQSRAAAPMTLTFAEPGTYELQMKTTSCAGARTDTARFTID